MHGTIEVRIPRRAAPPPLRANSDVFTTLRHKRRKENPKRATQKGVYEGAVLERMTVVPSNGEYRRRSYYHATKGFRSNRVQ
jgi:hypothetical protein